MGSALIHELCARRPSEIRSEISGKVRLTRNGVRLAIQPDRAWRGSRRSPQPGGLTMVGVSTLGA